MRISISGCMDDYFPHEMFRFSRYSYKEKAWIRHVPNMLLNPIDTTVKLGVLIVGSC